jgi:hypothetical protein
VQGLADLLEYVLTFEDKIKTHDVALPSFVSSPTFPRPKCASQTLKAWSAFALESLVGNGFTTLGIWSRRPHWVKFGDEIRNFLSQLRRLKDYMVSFQQEAMPDIRNAPTPLHLWQLVHAPSAVWCGMQDDKADSMARSRRNTSASAPAEGRVLEFTVSHFGSISKHHNVLDNLMRAEERETYDPLPITDEIIRKSFKKTASNLTSKQMADLRKKFWTQLPRLSRPCMAYKFRTLQNKNHYFVWTTPNRSGQKTNEGEAEYRDRKENHDSRTCATVSQLHSSMPEFISRQAVDKIVCLISRVSKLDLVTSRSVCELLLHKFEINSRTPEMKEAKARAKRIAHFINNEGCDADLIIDNRRANGKARGFDRYFAVCNMYLASVATAVHERRHNTQEYVESWVSIRDFMEHVENFFRTQRTLRKRKQEQDQHSGEG